MTALAQRKAIIDANALANAAERARRLQAMQEHMPECWAIYEELKGIFGEPLYFRAQEDGHVIKLGIDDGTFTGSAVRPSDWTAYVEPSQRSRRGRDVAGAGESRPSKLGVVDARAQLLALVRPK